LKGISLEEILETHLYNAHRYKTCTLKEPIVKGSLSGQNRSTGKSTHRKPASKAQNRIVLLDI